ncbi:MULTISPECIES: HNH endonuclease family protein [unclassified Agrococcus]|uniref:HNH endonuclease family protein n=1 Tax=unclassified Agrococcus TaxID=2615065 RepID=UPI00361A391E
MTARRGPGALGALSIAAFVLSVSALVASLVVPPLVAGDASAVGAEPVTSSPSAAPTPASAAPPPSVAPFVAPSVAPSAAPSATPSVAPAPSASSEALAQLAALPLTDPSAPRPDYVRDLFGERWTDVDGNGCDQRNDVLARDLESYALFPDRHCIVQTGVLADPYTGATIAFLHGEQTSQAVQIDHLIPLALAWRSGAWAWTDEQRLLFANDTSLLLAVEGQINQSRSDSDFDEWLPPVEAVHCSYVITIVDGLARYELSITASARAAAESVLVGCGDEEGLVRAAS